MKITAALAFDTNAPFVLSEVELADPAPHDVLVRIVASGLCHTDLNVLKNPALPWPAVFGHEGAGVVERVGSAVSRVAVGDHVILTTVSCGTCAQCISGEPSYCVDFRALNMSGGRCSDGTCSHTHAGKPVFARFLGQSSFASHSLVNERSVIKVDRDLPLEILAPLGCGIQTGAAAVLNTLRVRAGSRFVLFGAGGVGLAALMAAKIAGASQLIVVDRIASRLALARELGATQVIDASQLEAVQAVRQVSGGGVDYAVEATGVPAVMEQAIQVLGHGGTVVLVGMAGAQAQVTFNPIELQGKRAHIKGSIMAGEGGIPELFIPQLIQYWKAGLLPIEKLLRTYTFDDINQAVSDARDGSAIKPVIRMPQEV